MQIKRTRTVSSTVNAMASSSRRNGAKEKLQTQLERTCRSKMMVHRQASLMDEVRIHVLHSDLLLPGLQDLLHLPALLKQAPRSHQLVLSVQLRDTQASIHPPVG